MYTCCKMHNLVNQMQQLSLFDSPIPLNVGLNFCIRIIQAVDCYISFLTVLVSDLLSLLFYLKKHPVSIG